MSFDWQEYLTLAEFLRNFTGSEVNHEAAKRSAVSRAYYAGFGLARLHAEGQGFQPTRDADDHGGLQNHFRNTNRRNIAEHLSRLRGWRNKADYDDDVHNLPAMAKESIAEFRRLKNALDRPLGGGGGAGRG